MVLLPQLVDDKIWDLQMVLDFFCTRPNIHLYLMQLSQKKMLHWFCGLLLIDRQTSFISLLPGDTVLQGNLILLFPDLPRTTLGKISWLRNHLLLVSRTRRSAIICNAPVDSWKLNLCLSPLISISNVLLLQIQMGENNTVFSLHQHQEIPPPLCLLLLQNLPRLL